MPKLIEVTLGSGLKVRVVKDFYTGLWNIKYEDGIKYAGPYRTKREAVERIQRFIED